MSNKKQTAVDWLLNDYVHKGVITIEAIEQAKEMEKEQITEGFKKGLEYWNGDAWKLIDIQQYYKKTYETGN